MSGLVPPFPTCLHGVHRENATLLFILINIKDNIREQITYATTLMSS
jgi:hypothetical protein